MASTTRNILIGLALGVATGLFLGEKAEPFQLIAEGYLRLLQMTVLPYVMVSLIEGIGSLDGARAQRLFIRVGTLSLLLWALALGAVILMPFTFPEIESASFFSTTLVEARPPLDFVALYIPSNPFHSLLYPAFSVAVPHPLTIRFPRGAPRLGVCAVSRHLDRPAAKKRHDSGALRPLDSGT